MVDMPEIHEKVVGIIMVDINDSEKKVIALAEILQKWSLSS